MTRISVAHARKLGLVEDASELEADFAHALRMHGADLPSAVREWQFHPTRGWRFDWAFVAQKLAVEVDGGQHVAGGGRHNTDGDRAKLNAAATLGWRVLRFSGAMLANDPIGCVDAVRRALAAPGAAQ